MCQGRTFTTKDQPNLEGFFNGLLHPEPPGSLAEAAGLDEAIAVSRSAMARHNSPSASVRTIQKHSLSIGTPDDMAEPIPPLLAFTLRVEQQVERHIRLRQLLPEIAQHVEAVLALQPVIGRGDQQVDVGVWLGGAASP